jgi:hypothetical protein
MNACTARRGTSTGAAAAPSAADKTSAAFGSQTLEQLRTFTIVLPRDRLRVLEKSAL